MTDVKYYLLVVLTAFLSSVSQILLNVSATKKHKGKIFEYLNLYVMSSYAILFGVLLLNTYCMKFLLVKNAHAVAATSYVFTMILSRIILKEKITLKKVLGNLIIIAGVLIFIM